MTVTEIYSCFQKAERPVEMVKSEAGCFCGIAEGGRILACAFSPEEESLFFIHPSLGDIRKGGPDPVSLTGGPGGDRIRFGPEYTFAWVGGERDTLNFSNYRQQENEDPGSYFLELRDNTIIHRMETTLRDRINESEIEIRVERNTLPAAPPVELPGDVRFAGYRSHTRLEMGASEKKSTVGLWFLLQVPAGTTLLVPLKKKAAPLEYFNTGDWRLAEGAMIWPYGGSRNAKAGYGTGVITGRTGVISGASAGTQTLLVREFPVHREMYYCDGPTVEQAGDQVFQAWDGFGFGEMEYHSPAIGAVLQSASIDDIASLWAFEGPEYRIKEIIQELLGISYP